MRGWMLLMAGLLLFCAGCGPDEETGCTGDEDEDVDADGDGYCESTDCDESNPDINPGEAEVCNEIDDNCNGGMDEEEIEESQVVCHGIDGAPAEGAGRPTRSARQ